MSKKERYIRRGAFFAFILALVLLLCGSLYKPVQMTAVPYYVEQGDSLWSIASVYKPNDMRYGDYIRKVQEHNGIGSDIHAGDEILIFVEGE